MYEAIHRRRRQGNKESFGSGDRAALVSKGLMTASHFIRNLVATDRPVTPSAFATTTRAAHRHIEHAYDQTLDEDQHRSGGPETGRRHCKSSARAGMSGTRPVELLALLLVVLLVASAACEKSSRVEDEELLTMSQICPTGTTSSEETAPDHRYWWCHRADETKHGPFLAWYPTGQKWSRQTYRDGQLDGPAIVWYPNGERQQLRHFSNGVENGTFMMWSESGSLQFRSEFKDGKREGLFTQWRGDGSKSEEGRYVAGKKHGEWKSWTLDGKVSKIQVYDQGALNETRGP